MNEKTNVEIIKETIIKEIEELKLYKNILDKRFEILQQIKVVI